MIASRCTHVLMQKEFRILQRLKDAQQAPGSVSPSLNSLQVLEVSVLWGVKASPPEYMGRSSMARVSRRAEREEMACRAGKVWLQGEIRFCLAKSCGCGASFSNSLDWVDGWT